MDGLVQSELADVSLVIEALLRRGAEQVRHAAIGRLGCQCE